MAEKYDIFISYRREGGADFARHMQLKLQNYNYRVFLDYDELKDGRFDQRIMDAIASAPVFMFILSPHSLDRCCNEDDWVRQEIEFALQCGKHIVPVNPDRMFDDFPADCPDAVREGLGQHQFTEIFTGQQFSTTVEDMVRIRIKPLITEQTADNVGAIIHLETDLDCQVLKFGTLLCTVRVGEYKAIRLRKGNHKLEFVSIENTADRYSTVFPVKDNDMEDYLFIELKSIRDKRVKEEDAQKKTQRLLNIPDEEIGWFTDETTSKYGFRLKSTREIIISPKYDFAIPFSEGLAVVKINGKYGYIDKTGKEITPLKYDSVSRFSEGLAVVTFNGKSGFIDKSGKEITPLKYDDFGVFSEGLVRVKLNGKWGYIDKMGKEITPLKYDFAFDFSEGLAVVTFNGKSGFIDKTGKEIIPLKYDNADKFSEGLASVKLNGKWGFIDKTGKEIIPPKYDDDVYAFSEGLAVVELSARRFSQGKAEVRLNGKKFHIDKTGKRID